MANQFVNLPVPTSNTAGDAVDVSEMGATKTVVVGGQFKGAVTIEYATDDVGAGPWAPVPSGTFVDQGGRVTADFAARWMRATMQRYQSGTPNADVGGSGAGSTFALITSTPTDISALPGLKTIVSSAPAIVEISLDGISWSQAFSLPNAGAVTAVVYGALARTDGPSIWMGATDNTDQGTPPFPLAPVEVTIYARVGGSDLTGNGTLASPYRTFQRAIRDVPHLIPPGYIYTVDITEIGVEPLPPNYQFPAIVGPLKNTYPEAFGGLSPYPFYGSSFNIRAIPQPATTGTVGPIPLAQTSVPAADYTIAFDPISGLAVITTLTPRASWAGDNLKGKFCLQAGYARGNCAISGSDATHLYLCTADAVGAPGGLDLSIVECSATLQGTYNSQSDTAAIQCLNCPNIAFQGISFRALDPEGFGPYSQAIEYAGGTQPIMNLCDIEGIVVMNVSTNFNLLACTLRDKNVVFDGSEFSVYESLLMGIPELFIAGCPGNVTVTSVFDGCPALTGGIAYTTLGNYSSLGWQVANCEFKNCTDPHGVIWALGGDTFTLQNVKLANPVGPGVHSEGSAASVILENVVGTASTFGVLVEDGSTVRVLDNATSIVGTTGDMKVGTLTARTWADFRGLIPIKNQYDLSTPFTENSAGEFTPPGDELTGAGTGGRSGSRLFQRPVV